MDPKIAVIILLYNDRENVKDAFDSVLDQTYSNYELIAVDNASTDGTAEMVEKNYPSVRFKVNEKNLGYALGYQLAIREAFSGDFDAVVLLNSDVIVDRDWLKELVASSYADQKIAIAQPKIFLWDGQRNDLANTFGNNLNYLGFGVCGHYKKPDSPQFDRDRDVPYASGASMLIKKEAYQDIGELDDKFFAYLEDADISWRARLKGYRVILSARSVMWHKHRYDSNARNSWKFFMLERNRFYFIYKNYSARLIILILPALFIMDLGVIAKSIAGGFFIDKMKSYSAFLKNLKHLKPDRLRIQKERSVSDRELIKIMSPVIEYEELDSPYLSIANFVFSAYYRIIRRLI